MLVQRTTEREREREKVQHTALPQTRWRARGHCTPPSFDQYCDTLRLFRGFIVTSSPPRISLFHCSLLRDHLRRWHDFHWIDRLSTPPLFHLWFALLLNNRDHQTSRGQVTSRLLLRRWNSKQIMGENFVCWLWVSRKYLRLDRGKFLLQGDSRRRLGVSSEIVKRDATAETLSGKICDRSENSDLRF